MVTVGVMPPPSAFESWSSCIGPLGWSQRLLSQSHVTHIIQVDTSGDRIQTSKILRDWLYIILAVFAAPLVGFVARTEDEVAEAVMRRRQRCWVQPASFIR